MRDTLPTSNGLWHLWVCSLAKYQMWSQPKHRNSVSWWSLQSLGFPTQTKHTHTHTSKFNSSPLKNDSWKATYFPFGMIHIFRGELINFQGGTNQPILRQGKPEKTISPSRPSPLRWAFQTRCDPTACCWNVRWVAESQVFEATALFFSQTGLRSFFCLLLVPCHLVFILFFCQCLVVIFKLYIPDLYVCMQN